MAEYDPRAFTRARLGIQLATIWKLYPLYWIHHRLTISGRENVPADGPLVVVANHLSLLDPPILCMAANRGLAFIAKQELFRVWWVSRLLKYFGAISINRAQPELSTFKIACRLLRHNGAVAMFIEGTRNKTPGILGHPHLGPAYLARTTNAPILPVGIVGTNKRWMKASATIGKVIMPSDDLEKTTWEIMESLSALTGWRLPESTTSVVHGGPGLKGLPPGEH